MFPYLLALPMSVPSVALRRFHLRLTVALKNEYEALEMARPQLLKHKGHFGPRRGNQTLESDRPQAH